MLNVGKTHDTVRVVNDQIGTPTYTYDLARLLVDMNETEKYGYKPERRAQVQDEVNEKTMALCIKGGKISVQLLKAALTKLLSEIEKKKQQSKKMGGQNRCKRGKQSIKSLQQSGAQLTNIVVTDNNIKSFDRVARKYGIDYSLKKAEKEGKTEYLVFFKAKDVDVMTAAFKEYTGVSLKKEQRQSIRKKLEQAKERVAKHREITKEKTKDRGQVR